jgi:hypothetical protein
MKGKQIRNEIGIGDGTAMGLADVSRCQLMSGFSEKLGRKKESAVMALLTSRNVDEAARAAGVTPRTLYRWQKEPEFEAACREARRAAVSQANGRLQQATGAAVTTMLKLMLDHTVPASVRIKACECVLDHANKTIEIADIEVRVEALEAAARKTGPTMSKPINSSRLRKTETINDGEAQGFIRRTQLREVAEASNSRANQSSSTSTSSSERSIESPILRSNCLRNAFS